MDSVITVIVAIMNVNMMLFLLFDSDGRCWCVSLYLYSIANHVPCLNK